MPVERHRAAVEFGHATMGNVPTAERGGATDHRGSSEVEMANAKAAATRRTLWEHQCESELTLMLVGSGEACSWCGKTEDFGSRPRHALEEDRAIRDQNVPARNADTVPA
jgi:hypothetical protein